MIKYLLRLKWKKETEVHFKGCIYAPQTAKQKGKLNVWLILYRNACKAYDICRIKLRQWEKQGSSKNTSNIWLCTSESTGCSHSEPSWLLLRITTRRKMNSK